MKSKLQPRFLALSVLLLSLAIFNWGLQYKMSLYKSVDSSAHSQAPAKFWTGNKDHGQALDAPMVFANHQQRIHPLCLPFTLLLLHLALPNQRSFEGYFESPEETAASKPHLAKLQELQSFRPPPTIA